MHTVVRALVLLPLCTSLSACANAGWLPSFLRNEPTLQAAQLTGGARAANNTGRICPVRTRDG